jgi:peptide chain release factor subunit 1
MQQDIQRKRLEKLIGELEKIRGRHTELVTVYVPADFNLAKVVEQIRQEQSTAQNIKSKTVRKDVLAALEKINQHLKFYRKTPKNGLAIFCGNVSEKEGAADIELWSIEPPEPIKNRLYRCDQVFVVDALKDMVREREIYGLIVLDKSDAEIGLLKGKKVEVLKHMESIVPGKTKAGGWSANRYARIREGLLEDFLKKVAEIASAQLKAQKDLKGVIIGGPGPVKEQFYAADYLNYEIKNKVLGVVNTSYTGEPGLNEIIQRSEDLLAEASVIRENKILDRFFNEFAKDTGMAVYGFNEVMEALKSGNLEVLLVSESFEWVKAKFKCTACGEVFEKMLPKENIKDDTCPKCGGKPELLEQSEIIDELVKMAEDMSTNVEMISVDTPKGEQLKELGGIAGILRYKTG